MAQETVFKRSVAGSIGAGVKSVMGNSERRYYILEHKISSKYHKVGENQKIIVDEIEIGRDATCQVRFDETFTTVSRKHAAIVKDGDNWKLVQLSKTNSTFLNGKRVEKEWYLQNGDEIQLSTNGPKLGFIIPSGDKSLVKSIGMTARLNLFRQQALRPYKTALSILAIILLVGVAFGTYSVIDLSNKNAEQAQVIRENEARYAAEMAKQDSLLNEAKQKSKELDEEVNKLRGQFKKINSEQRKIAVAAGAIDNEVLKNLMPFVYYIFVTHIDVTMPNGEKGTLDCSDPNLRLGWSGTGFLLEDGSFVTARHVIESWYFLGGSSVDENLLNLNVIDNNGGKVVAHFTAVSSSGDIIRLRSDNFKCKRNIDKVDKWEGYKVSYSPFPNRFDYAVCKLSKKAGLPFSPSISNELERGTRLAVLGFPLSLGVSSTKVEPILGSVMVSASGLQNGCILTTDTNYESGNSGGPVFYTDEEGKMSVVGIVSAAAGRNAGFIIPISKIK